MTTEITEKDAERFAEALGTGLREGLRLRDQRVAQATADAVVQALREKGLLRETPATRAVVHRIVRDASGQIVATFERVELLEPIA